MAKITGDYYPQIEKMPPYVSGGSKRYVLNPVTGMWEEEDFVDSKVTMQGNTGPPGPKGDPGKAAPDELKTAVSIEYKVNLGNYESASVFVSVSNIGPTTSPDEVEWMLDQGQLAWKEIKKKLMLEAQDLKDSWGNR